MAGWAPSAEELAQELAEAVAANDTARAIRLTRQIEARLEADLTEPPPRASTSRQAKRKVPASDEGASSPARKSPRSTSSARQTVTAALGEIGVPARARLVADYCEARFGERIDTRAFSALRRDERRAWTSSSSRPTYVVPALEGRFFQPIRGLLALSDWPIERRLISPWSERADHLAATIQLAKQLGWISGRDVDLARRLTSIVAGMSRSIPGALHDREVDPGRVEEAAEDELREVAEHDGPWRREAATRARQQLSSEEQLWGSRVAIISSEEG